MKKKVIDELVMADYIKSKLNNVEKELILKILDYELKYLELQGLVK